MSEKSEASDTESESERSGHILMAGVGDVEGDEVGEGDSWRRAGYSCSSVDISAVDV